MAFYCLFWIQQDICISQSRNVCTRRPLHNLPADHTHWQPFPPLAFCSLCYFYNYCSLCRTSFLYFAKTHCANCTPVFRAFFSLKVTKQSLSVFPFLLVKHMNNVRHTWTSVEEALRQLPCRRHREFAQIMSRLVQLYSQFGYKAYLLYYSIVKSTKPTISNMRVI